MPDCDTTRERERERERASLSRRRRRRRRSSSSMDVYISEDYVKSRREMRKREKQLHLEIDLKPDSSSTTKVGMAPKTPGPWNTSLRAFSSPSPAAPSENKTRLPLEAANSLDSIFHCITP